jgi:DDE superfamily endonuclease
LNRIEVRITLTVIKHFGACKAHILKVSKSLSHRLSDEVSPCRCCFCPTLVALHRRVDQLNRPQYGAMFTRDTSRCCERCRVAGGFGCEYRREDTGNIFVFLDAHRSWRDVKITERRTALDFAHYMREFSDLHYPHAERIRVVLDNLSTHSAAALYETLTPPKARCALRRLEFHYTHKHASWLDMAEIEVGILRTPVSGSTHPGPSQGRIGDRRLAVAAQRLRRTHQMDVRCRAGPVESVATLSHRSAQHCRLPLEPVRITVQRY